MKIVLDVNPNEIPEVIGILKELTDQTLIEPAEPEIATDEAVKPEDMLKQFIREKLEAAQVTSTTSVLSDIVPVIKNEIEKQVNLIKLREVNRADYEAMFYADAADKMKDSISKLTNLNKGDADIIDFVSAFEAATLDISLDKKKELLKALTEVARKDPYILDKVAVSKNDNDNCPAESTEYDDIFRILYRYIETVSEEWNEDMTEIDWDSPYVINELENYKASVSNYGVSIDASDKNRIILSIERMTKKSGYYSNMLVTKELFCARFQFVDSKLTKVYMTDPISVWTVYNGELTALISKLDAAITEFKPEIIIREVNEPNIHL